MNPNFKKIPIPSKKLDVLVIFDSAGTPPDDQNFKEEFKTADWTAEADVVYSVKKLGHHVRALGVYDDISLIIDEVNKQMPDIIFNLTEVFNGRSESDHNIVSLFELLEIPYTGTSPYGLMLCKDKGLSKKVLTYHDIRTPIFQVIERGAKIIPPKQIGYPILVKPLREEASYGISQNSLVNNDKEFIERVKKVHQSMNLDVIVEEYIEGREIYVSIVGNQQLQVFPLREMVFNRVENKDHQFATFKSKWDQKYRKKWGIQNRFVKNLSPEVVERIEKICKRTYRLLGMKGYGRIDVRLTPQNEVVVLEANPNPHISDEEDFARSVEKGEVNYYQLIHRILNLGLQSSGMV